MSNHHAFRRMHQKRMQNSSFRAPFTISNPVDFARSLGADVKVVHTGLYSRYAFDVLNGLVNSTMSSFDLNGLEILFGAKAKVEYNGEVVIEVVNIFRGDEIDIEKEAMKALVSLTYAYTLKQVKKIDWDGRSMSARITFPTFVVDARDMHFIYDFLVGMSADYIEKHYAQDLREYWTGRPLDPVSAELIQALSEQADSLEQEEEKEEKQIDAGIHELIIKEDKAYTKAAADLEKEHRRKIDELDDKRREAIAEMHKRIEAKRADITKEYNRIMQTTNVQHEEAVSA